MRAVQRRLDPWFTPPPAHAREQNSRGEEPRVKRVTPQPSLLLALHLCKVLGDANVPRGELTWRSEPGYAYYGAWRMPVLHYPGSAPLSAPPTVRYDPSPSPSPSPSPRPNHLALTT